MSIWRSIIISMSSTKLVFWANRKKQDDRPGVRLAETFSTSLKPLFIIIELKNSLIHLQSDMNEFCALLLYTNLKGYLFIGSCEFSCPGWSSVNCYVGQLIFSRFVSRVSIQSNATRILFEFNLYVEIFTVTGARFQLEKPAKFSNLNAT